MYFDSSSTTVVDYHPDCTPELLAETIDILDRWSKRTEAHVSKRRARPRFAYRGTVTLVSPIRTPGEASIDERALAVFHVTARNISQCGVGLIVPPTFLPVQMSDKTPLILSESLFREGLRVTVAISGPGVELGPVDGVIVRQRRVHHEFLELGVKFLERHEAAPADGDLSLAEKSTPSPVLNS
jgi:hypothetical protein